MVPDNDAIGAIRAMHRQVTETAFKPEKAVAGLLLASEIIGVGNTDCSEQEERDRK